MNNELKSNQQQALEAVALAIKKLGLPGMPANEIVVRSQAWRGSGQEITYHRGISVHPGDERESRGTNERDDIGYAIYITIVKPQNHDTAEGVGTLANWRRAIRKRFNHVRLGIKEAGSSELTTTCQPATYRTPRGMKNRYEASVLLVRCWVREATLRSEDR